MERLCSYSLFCQEGYCCGYWLVINFILYLKNFWGASYEAY
jgi:hypothetical protein